MASQVYHTREQEWRRAQSNFYQGFPQNQNEAEDSLFSTNS
jgi:hypothetical protein